MNKIICLILGLFILTIAAFGQSKKIWERTKSLNTVEAYESFISKFPKGEYSELAKNYLKLIEQNEFFKAKQINTVNSYQEYISKYKQSVFIKDAQTAVADLNWQLAVKENTKESYEEFIKKNLDSKYNEAAKSLINSFEQEAKDKIEWEQVQKTNKIDAYNEFILKNWRSKYIQEANQALSELYWQNALKENNRESYEKFLYKFPSSEHQIEANKLLEEFSWNQTHKSNTVEDYESFFSKYPQSAHLTDSNVNNTNLAWVQSKFIGTLDSYEKFASKYPNSSYSKIAIKEAGRIKRNLYFNGHWSGNSKITGYIGNINGMITVGAKEDFKEGYMGTTNASINITLDFQLTEGSEHLMCKISFEMRDPLNPDMVTNINFNSGLRFVDPSTYILNWYDDRNLTCKINKEDIYIQKFNIHLKKPW